MHCRSLSTYCQSVLSLKFIKLPVDAVVACTAIDPTADTVEFAFKLPGVNPGPGDFTAGSWETGSCGTLARILVGPGGSVTLAVGTYVMWIKITDSPEIPVEPVGYVEIF